MKEKQELLDTVEACNSIDADRIMEELSHLYSTNYWKNLPPEADLDEDDTGWDDSMLVDSQEGEGFLVSAVTLRGWVCHRYLDEGSHFLLLLPPHVTDLGHKGMSIKYIDVWQRCDNGNYQLGAVDGAPHCPRRRIAGDVYPPDKTDME